MKVQAAIAFAPGEPLRIETVDLEGPRAGEVLVELKATGVCHTDDFTRSGADPEGLFPAILGHEGAGVVVDVGPGVTSVRKGDHVIAWLSTGRAMVLTWFAANYLGAVFVPLNTAYRGDVLHHVINAAGARLMVAHHARRQFQSTPSNSHNCCSLRFV